METVVRRNKQTAMERLQERIGRLSQHSRLERNLAKALAAPREPLPANLIDDFAEVLGDPSLSSEFNQAAMSAIERGAGPVLQCGAGPSTLMFGLLAQRRDRHLWILEDDSQWAHWTRSALKRYGLANAHLIAVPATLFDGYVSYVIDSTRLPQDFSLAICSGSSAQAASLRGLLQRLGGCLDHRCVILARGLRSPRDLNFAAKWSKKRNVPFVVNGKLEPYGKIALRDRRPEEVLEEERADTVYGKQHLIEVRMAAGRPRVKAS